MPESCLKAVCEEWQRSFTVDVYTLNRLETKEGCNDLGGREPVPRLL